VALISGTGCVTYAQNQQGEKTVRGGWGYLLGDEGSGFWIGLQAIRAAIRAEDGRSPRTQFTDEIMTCLGVTTMRAAQAMIYNESIKRPQIARLTPVVMKAADQGDEIANAIVLQAAQELFSLVRATCEAAGLTQLEEKIIVPTGGVMRTHTPVYRAFAALVERELPSYRVIPPQLPPVGGAFILGLILAGVDVDEKILERIETTLASLPTARLKL